MGDQSGGLGRVLVSARLEDSRTEVDALLNKLQELGIDTVAFESTEQIEANPDMIKLLDSTVLVVILGSSAYGKGMVTAGTNSNVIDYVIEYEIPVFLVKLCDEFEISIAQEAFPEGSEHARWPPNTPIPDDLPTVIQLILEDLVADRQRERNSSFVSVNSTADPPTSNSQTPAPSPRLSASTRQPSLPLPSHLSKQTTAQQWKINDPSEIDKDYALVCYVGDLSCGLKAPQDLALPVRLQVSKAPPPQEVVMQQDSPVSKEYQHENGSKGDAGWFGLSLAEVWNMWVSDELRWVWGQQSQLLTRGDVVIARRASGASDLAVLLALPGEREVRNWLHQDLKLFRNAFGVKMRRHKSEAERGWNGQQLLEYTNVFNGKRSKLNSTLRDLGFDGRSAHTLRNMMLPDLYRDHAISELVQPRAQIAMISVQIRPVIMLTSALKCVWKEKDFSQQLKPQDFEETTRALLIKYKKEVKSHLSLTTAPTFKPNSCALGLSVTSLFKQSRHWPIGYAKDYFVCTTDSLDTWLEKKHMKALKESLRDLGFTQLHTVAFLSEADVESTIAAIGMSDELAQLFRAEHLRLQFEIESKSIAEEDRGLMRIGMGAKFEEDRSTSCCIQ